MPANDRNDGLPEEPNGASTSPASTERTAAAPSGRVGGSDAATDRSAILEGDEPGFTNQAYVTAGGVVPAGAARTEGGMDVDEIQNGWDVYGSDGEKIGNVEEVGSAYLLVLTGFFSTKNIYVPTDAIVGIQNDRVFIGVSKHQMEGLGWDQPPADMSGAAATTTGPTGVVTASASADDRRLADAGETTGFASEAARTEPAAQAAREPLRAEPAAPTDGITVRPRKE